MRVIVVGAGVFGAWTAFHLHQAGASVTLVEAYSPAHSRSSSGDETRIVRAGYGPDAIYSVMARRSLEQWRQLDHAIGGSEERLWHPCGVLWLAADDDGYARATQATLERLGHPLVAMDAAAARRRFPGLDLGGVAMALLELECGVVLARRAVRALVQTLVQQGVNFVRGKAVPERDDPGMLRLSDTSRLTADHIVYACGPWLPQLLPAVLHGRIRPTRQVVAYFGTPPGDATFDADRWPAWVDFPAGIYGTPDINGRGVKVGIDTHGAPMDPDAENRLADARSLEIARAWLARRIPRLADAPVVETRVCQYENTATGDFVIDRHPDHARVWIVGGGSGHGFKHGPAVGEIVTRMVLRGEPADARFSLLSKTTDARRAIF